MLDGRDIGTEKEWKKRKEGREKRKKGGKT